jgi:hypothetical protein
MPTTRSRKLAIPTGEPTVTASKTSLDLTNTGREVRPIPDPTRLTTEALHREILGLEKQICIRIEASEKAVRLLQAESDRHPTVGEIAVKIEERFRSVFDLIANIEKGFENQFHERDIRTDKLAEGQAVALTAALNAQKDSVVVAFQAQKEFSASQNQANERASETNRIATAKLLDQIAQAVTAAGVATTEKFTTLAILATNTQSNNDAKFTDTKDLIISTGNTLKDLNNASNSSWKEQVSTLNARMTAFEGRTVGADKADKRTGENAALIVSIIGGGTLALTAAATFIVMVLTQLKH